MNRSDRLRRIGAACVILASAMLVAVGCGGGGGGGAAASSDQLEFVPKGAPLYAVFNTDFNGDEWKQADHLGKQFPTYAKLKSRMLDSLNDVSFGRDIKPWLGDEAGVAVLDAKADDMLAWVTLKDDAKAKAFFKKECDVAKTEKSGDYTITTCATGKGTREVAYTIKNEVLLVSDAAKPIKVALKAKDDGESITDVDGVEDAASELDEDALVSVVISGEGLRKLLEDQKLDSACQGMSLTGLEQIKALKAMSFGVSAEDKGMRLKGFVGFDEDDLEGDDPRSENAKPELIESLPGNTIGLIAGNDLGNHVPDLVELLQECDETVGERIALGEAVVGVTVDDFAKAFSGEYVVAMTEAAKPGPQSPADVGLVAKASDKDQATEVVESLTKAVGSAPGAVLKDVEIEGEQATELTIRGRTVVSGTFDDTSIAASNRTFIESFLGDGETFGDTDRWKDARDVSGMPDEVSGVFFLTPEAIKSSKAFEGLLADPTRAANIEQIGSLLAWTEAADDDQTFELFLAIG